MTLIALDLNEQRQEVISCGRAGYAGYVPRDASIDALCKMLHEIVAGRLACPPEISCCQLRALFRKDTQTTELASNLALTRRESEVLGLLGRGLSNKEIGAELCMSVATVKHHVHLVLEKLKLPRRAQDEVDEHHHDILLEPLLACLDGLSAASGFENRNAYARKGYGLYRRAARARRQCGCAVRP